MVAHCFVDCVCCFSANAYVPISSPTEALSADGFTICRETKVWPFTRPNGSSSVWQRLYRLVWPLGYFGADPGSAVSKATEKSASGAGVSRLYLVNISTGSIRESLSAAGVQQPTICPDSTSMFYRRGKRLFRERVQPMSEDVLAATPPQRLEGVAVTWLYACPQDGKGGVSLWAETADGAIRVLRIRNDSAAWEDLPNDRTLHPFEPQSGGSSTALQIDAAGQICSLDSRSAAARTETHRRDTFPSGALRPSFLGISKLDWQFAVLVL